jgi:hypothetical protein
MRLTLQSGFEISWLYIKVVCPRAVRVCYEREVLKTREPSQYLSEMAHVSECTILQIEAEGMPCARSWLDRIVAILEPVFHKEPVDVECLHCRKREKSSETGQLARLRSIRYCDRCQSGKHPPQI